MKRDGKATPIRMGKTKKYGASTTTAERTRNSIEIEGEKSKFKY